MEKELASFEEDLTDAEWHDDVAQPCRELVAAMDVLTENFSTSLILELIYRFAIFVTMTCLLLSPTRQDIGTRLGAEWVTPASTAILIVGIAGPFVFLCVTIYGPASLSTACDDLKERLNGVRISDLTKEVDARVIILGEDPEDQTAQTCVNSWNRYAGLFCV